MDKNTRSVELAGISFLLSLDEAQMRRLKLANGEIASFEQKDLAAKVLGFNGYSDDLNEVTVLHRLATLSVLPIVGDIKHDIFLTIFDAADVLIK